MSLKSTTLEDLEVHPVTPERWGDLEKLFGASGAYAGCWCMWWRSTRSEFGKRGGQGNKEHGAKIVERYPIEAKESNLPSVSSLTGLASTFVEVGFVEVLRRSERQPIMRYFIEG